MSLVGPRPPATEEEFEIHYGSLAHIIFQDRPGLTGLWQVSDRHSSSYDQRVWMNLLYAQRGSFGMDLKILLKTIPVVVVGRGSF
jgi:lipopolysaccharide/colanic/teichoic acid biosynthesis glycosyltransferase